MTDITPHESKDSLPPQLSDAAIPVRPFSDLLETMQAYDERRYGMGVNEAENYVFRFVTNGTVGDFREKYGIELSEYVERLIDGEWMGESMKHGKFLPRKPHAPL